MRCSLSLSLLGWNAPLPPAPALAARCPRAQAGDASGPHEYPFVQMIGVGTPVDLCQELDIGDRIKSINGVFLKGEFSSRVPPISPLKGPPSPYPHPHI